MMANLDVPPSGQTFEWKHFKDWFYKLWKWVKGISSPFGNTGTSPQDGGYSNALAMTAGLFASDTQRIALDAGITGDYIPTFRAYGQSSNQSISNATYTTLTNWANVAGDTYGAFNASTGVYTIPASGLWMFSTYVSIQSTTGSWSGAVVGTGLFFGGLIQEPQVYNRITPTTSTYAGFATSLPQTTWLRLSAGQTVAFQVYQSSGGTATTEGNSGGANHTYFFGVWLGPN